MTAPELSIIIVNWNGIDFLPNCLKSISENPPSLPFEIIVVDNNSSDGSVEWLMSAEAKDTLGQAAMRLIQTGENAGFGRANNLAFDETSTPYIFLLNPDTVVNDGAIDKLLDTLNSEKGIGAVVPKLLNSDGTIQINVWGGPPTPTTIIVNGFKLHRLLPKRLLEKWLYGAHWNYRERTVVPIIGAAAVLAKREMVEDVGGFDPRIHMYAEDLEWSLRINRKGWKIFFEPEATVFHLDGRSSEQRWDNLEKGFVQEESLLIAQKIALSPAHLFLNCLAKSFVYTFHFLRRKRSGESTAVLKKVIGMQMGTCHETFWKVFGR